MCALQVGGVGEKERFRVMEWKSPKDEAATFECVSTYEWVCGTMRQSISISVSHATAEHVSTAKKMN